MKFIKVILLIFLLSCLIPSNIFTINTDSLIKLLNKTPNNNKAKLFNKISFLELKKDPQKTIEFALKAIENAKLYNQKEEEIEGYINLGAGNFKLKKTEKAFENYKYALDLSQKYNIKSKTGIVLSEFGDSYNKLGNITKSIEYYNYSIKTYKELKDTARWARILHQIAGVYDDAGNYQAALDYYKKSLELKQKINDKKGVGNSYNNIGIIYKDMGDYSKSLEYHLKAQAIYEEIGNSNDAAMSYMNIGIIYKNLEDYKKSLDYSNKALDAFKKANNIKMIARVMNNIGNVFAKLNDFFRAEEYFDKALALFKELDDIKMQAKCMNNIGNLKLRIGNRDSALYYYLKAKDIHNEIDDKQGLAIIYQNMGNIYIEKGKFKKALEYVQQSLAIAEEIGIKEIMKDNYYFLTEIYETFGDSKKVIKYLRKHEALKDSIYNVEIAKSLSDLQYKYDIEKKNKENILLKKENESRNKIALQFILLTILSIILLILILSRNIFKRKTYRLISEKNDDLEKINVRLTDSENHLKELNATKDKFFSIIAHDLINPFNAFMETTKYLYGNYDKLSGNEIKELLGDISESSKNLHTLLENLLQWSRSQTGKISFNPDNISIKYIIDNIYFLMKLNSEKKNIQINYKINEDIMVYADPFMVTTIMRNLISNALKFTNEGGEILIFVKNSSDFVEIEVKDNGIGMSSEIMNNLFKIDVQFTTLGTEQEQGTGLGLVLCKEFIERNGGAISVESEPRKGSSFKFTLPKPQLINNAD